MAFAVARDRQMRVPFGRATMKHEFGELKTQPTENPGACVACGVIGNR
jgi:hypothetical protein